MQLESIKGGDDVFAIGKRIKLLLRSKNTSIVLKLEIIMMDSLQGLCDIEWG